MKRYDISKLDVLKPNAYIAAQICGTDALRYIIGGATHPFYDAGYISTRMAWSHAMLAIYQLHCFESHIASVFYTRNEVHTHCIPGHMAKFARLKHSKKNILPKIMRP